MKTTEIRKRFLDFFQAKKHALVSSSSLVPIDDPSLLFTNAGMVQFKKVFLGQEKRDYVRATSSQRCVRAGGKHNDLENVGYTARHHTFFEMLGNFSFGDYFKKEAIHFAWELLTEVFKIPPAKLWITVFQDDDEAANIWLKDIKIDKNRFTRCDEKDNFWAMGETGPCGPCTEIYYDHGEGIPGGPPGSGDEGDRYVEIWNLVFMQFDRTADGVLMPLPKPCVDTGMGLERMAAALQGVHSNYDIDLFQSLIHAIAKLANTTDLKNKSLRVIADHIRATAFLILDGVVPSNEGRGYVLRRIMRRAIRHGYFLNLHEPFFYRLVAPLGQVMGDAYPGLLEKQAFIERVIEQEELQFARTLEQGLRLLEQDLAKVEANTIPGETVFRLYDTYGFPVDLTADIARERGLKLDMDGFNEAMARQRTRAREASQFSGPLAENLDINHTTDFTGYTGLQQTAKILGIYQNGKPVPTLKTGEKGWVVLESTPFYAESGGQIGDSGILEYAGSPGSPNDLFEVTNTRKVNEAHVHEGILKQGELQLGMPLIAKVNKTKRLATALNHSATHLLHAAMREVVGNHVQQKGSLVEPERLRFDFSHFEPLTKTEIQKIEIVVNEQIRLNTEVQTDVMTVENALQTGAMALFGEKYGSTVRVLRMGGDFSVELCGGTHVHRTGDIGLFKIIYEGGIAAGVRRLEAVTGNAALAWVEHNQSSLEQLAALLKCNREGVMPKIEQLLQKQRSLEKELQQTKLMLASGPGKEDLEAQAKVIQGVKVLSTQISVSDSKTLREMVDRLKMKLKPAVIVLAGVEDQKVNIVVGVTSDLPQLNAGELVNRVAALVDGKGGGRQDMAQAGGNNPAALKTALESVYAWVEERIQQQAQA